jgi:hypothetical protein
MKEITAYNIKTRKQSVMKHPQLITMKNGKMALKGLAADDGKTTLYRIVSAADAQKFKSEK